MKETVVLSFGRMNPMTNGHEKLVDKIKSEASERNADAKLYLSHSTNSKKDPLNFATKVKFAKKAFGTMVQNSPARTIIEVAKELTGKYDNLVVVVGSDRISEFKTLLNKYNGKDFNFKSIEIMSAGERDPDTEGVEGMSGLKLRGFAANNDFGNFKKGVPSKLSDEDTKALFVAVREGMNLKEELEQQTEAVLDFTARRKRAAIFKRLAPRIQRARLRQMTKVADPQRLKQRAIKSAYKFFRNRIAGQDYAQLGTSQKISIDTKLQKLLPAIRKFAVRLIPQERKADLQRRQNFLVNRMKKEDFDINDHFTLFVEDTEVAQDRDLAKRQGTQPSKYYKGLDKETKEKRSAHFAKTGPKSDSDPDAYKDAPGDKEAREKGLPLSKHTKKYNQMFGEATGKKSLSRLDQLVRMGLADAKLLSTIKRSVEKLNSGETLNPAERTATQDLLQTLLDVVLSTDSLFKMTKQTLQREDVRLDELVYKGNIGVMEMFAFFQTATPQQISEMKKLIAEKKYEDALDLLAKVTGKKLQFRAESFNLSEDDDWKEVDGLRMAQVEIANLLQDAEKLLEILSDMDEDPDAWVLSKITRAVDYIETVTNYLEFEDNFDYDDEEEDGEYTGYEDKDEYEMEMEQILLSMDKEELGDLYEEVRIIFEEIEGLQKKAEKSGIPYSILKQVYNRGMAAWQGGHRPGTTPQQWAFARVNSFITKGKGTWSGADSDLADKVKKNEEFSKFIEALEWGTDEMRKAYAAATPGQSEKIDNANYSSDEALKLMNNVNRQKLFKLYSESTKDDKV